jgi:exonuclease SbcC
VRPHLLTIEAMGPYAGTETVSFDDLAAEGLFLIHGPTGSGKTFLFDALCFALYGEVPGARGDRGLVSHHAPAGATPRVSLEFTAQGGRYRVVREPFHEAAKKRGTGTTVRHPTASLERLDAGHQATLATKASEVRAEVVRLVGLSATQFQQVILLPQGQFEAVLRGKPETREALLETLFQTTGFEDLTEWLLQEARTKRHLVAEGQRRLAILAEEARRRALELGPTDPDTLFDPGEVAGGIPDQAALDRLADRAALVLADAEAEVAAAQARVEDQQDRAAQVTTVAERWDRAHQATDERARLAAATPAIDAARSQLALGLQAEQVRPSLVAAEAAAAARRQADRAAARHLQRAAAARGALLRPVADLDAIPLHLLPSAVDVAAARRSVAVEAGEVEAAAALHARLADARRDAGELRARASRDEALAANGEAEAARLRQEAHEAAAELAVAATARDRLDGLAAAAQQAEEEAAAAVRLQAVRARLAVAQADLVTARSLANGAWSAHLDLRSAYLDGIAAVLAQGLQPDAPCQVCGATEHPDPAQAAPDAVTLAQVELAEAASEAARSEADRCGEVVAELARLEAVEVNAAGAAAADPEDARDAAANARHKWQKATELAGTVGERQEAMTRRSAQADELESLATAAAAAAHEARSGAEQLEVAARTIAQDLAAVLDPGVDPHDAREALDLVDAALVALAAHAGSCDDARQAQEAAEARLAADLAASPFTHLDHLRAALLTPAERQALAARVERHDLRWATVLDTLADPLLADLPHERPDAGGAAAQVAAAQHANDRAVDRRSRVHAAHARIDQLAHEHRELLATVVPLESDAVLHEAVANRCAGKVAPKVSLQRWVLATYLEAICEHANRRLAAMTAGRYQLLVAREGGHAAARAGLDLIVHDAHTGTHRPVSDLSGGETFQASLALALGVADSVEARTGGVRLDALFIDEGFGTLDAEVLQLALDELDGLRAGGRMVGVISHVGALRERIRTGIEVTAGDQGSSVRVGAVSAA